MFFNKSLIYRTEYDKLLLYFRRKYKMNLKQEKTFVKVLFSLLSVGMAIVDIIVITLMIKGLLSKLIGSFLFIGLVLIEFVIWGGLNTLNNLLTKSMRVEETLIENNLTDEEVLNREEEGEQIILPPEVPYDDEEGDEETENE